MSHIRRLLGAAPSAVSAMRERLAATPETMQRLRGRFATRLHAEEAEFLTGIHSILHAPVPLTARIFPLVLMALFVIALSWSFVSETDVVSSTQGKVIPSTRVKLIQPAEQAVVKKIFVREGQAVRAADALVELDNTLSVADRNQVQHELQVDLARAARLQLLAGANHDDSPKLPYIEGIDSQIMEDEQVLLNAAWQTHVLEQRTLDRKIENFRSDIRGLEAETARLSALIEFSTHRVERVRILAEKGHATRASLEDAEEQLVERKFEMATKRENIVGKRSDISLTEEEKRASREKFRQQQLESLAQTEKEISGLEKEMEKLDFQVRQMILRAPIDGTVLDMDINTEGGVVQPAAVVMKIVPKESPLEVEALVLNRDIGFIHSGQRVKVKIETFTFTKYGAIEGTVRKVAQDATHDDKLGTVYRALVDLDKDQVKVESQEVRLKPGMNVTVDIETGKRRLIEYILTPILKYQDEALRER